MEQICCNCCGQLISKEGNKREDYLRIEKEWGYFSDKDREIHEFYICEKCYDRWIMGFRIPVAIRETEEVL